jgi:putative ABC transport system substrate-binding protein
MIKRRQFIAGLGSAAAWPAVARAQQRAAVPVIGFVHSASSDEYEPFVAAFRHGLSQTGYIEGRNVAIEYHWAYGRYDRLPEFVAEVVRREVAVIVAGGNPTPLVAKAATATIPIVFSTGSDPVEVGLVASLNRPGGNLTGVVTFAVEVAPKRLELLHELVPTATMIAVLINPTNPNAETQSRDLQAAASVLGLRLHFLQASSERDFTTVFAALGQMRAGGLVIGGDGFFISQGKQLAALALRHAVPTIFQYHNLAAAGGLMSYGSSLTDQYRLVGIYTGRILNGEKPADLPVQQATRVELIINLKTAKALGLTIPETLLATADEVIQ